MNLSYEFLHVLIYLIPGFISSTIMNIMNVRTKEQKEFGKIIEALIFSLLVYTIYSLVIKTSPIEIVKTGDAFTYSYNYQSFLWLILICIGIPLIFSFFITNDLHMKLARALRISKKTARSSVWFDVFTDKKTTIIINFVNGRRIWGWPMYYSDDPKNAYIFLYKPAWIEEDKFIDLDIEGILITPEQKIESIEFLKGGKNE